MAPWLLGQRFGDFSRAAAAAFIVVGVVYAVAVFTLAALRRLPAMAGVMGLGMMLVVGVLFGFYLPNAGFLRLPQRIGERLRELGAVEEGQIIMMGFAEPSLAFYQGGTIRARPKQFLTQRPVDKWPQWIVLSGDLYEKLPPEKQSELEEVARFRGLNYNVSPRPVEVLILKNKLVKGKTEA
jgi:hypothetical protein